MDILKPGMTIDRADRIVLLVLITFLMANTPALAQSRISTKGDCSPGAAAIHFDQTIYQADYKIMVSDYEVEPDIRIRTVKQIALADLVLADDLTTSDFNICRSSSRYQSTTLFVAKFVTQPDVVIMLNENDRHADYTLYVDSEIVSDAEAAALFWLAWERAGHDK